MNLVPIQVAIESGSVDVKRRERIQLPLIEGESGEIVNPTREELDASLWG